jgi:uncharacterized Zn finger protein (UPF0148 family)
MRICPHCGFQIPDNNNNIYCPACNQIADEEVLLRMKIEKKINKNTEEPSPEKETSSKRVKDRRMRKNNDNEDKNSYVSVIISILVVAAIIAAIFIFIK